MLDDYCKNHEHTFKSINDILKDHFKVIEGDMIEESSQLDSQDDSDNSVSTAAEVIASTVDESKPEQNQESDPNHKCWVCLDILPINGWQACPKCGARYHLGDSDCGISKLPNCRNCEANVSEFVKV